MLNLNAQFATFLSIFNASKTCDDCNESELQADVVDIQSYINALNTLSPSIPNKLILSICGDCFNRRFLLIYNLILCSSAMFLISSVMPSARLKYELNINS